MKSEATSSFCQGRFAALVENGYLKPGQSLYFHKDPALIASIKPDARLRTKDGFEGSIHKTDSRTMYGAPCNGWENWYVEIDGQTTRRDAIRQRFRIEMGMEK